MQRAINIFILVFYTFGTLCLPLGDFSTLQDIPDMYVHCKATEDKDMTPLDFFTDHLVNIDGVFDQHNKGDKQKSHQSKQIQHRGHQPIFVASRFTFAVKQIIPNQINPSMPFYNIIPSDYISKIFRPPII